MVIETECRSCGRSYRVKDELEGRKIRCKDCGKPFVVKVAVDEEDDWGDDYGDDEYGSQDAYSQPAALPRRGKSAAKKKNTAAARKRSKSAGNGRPVWKIPVGILGICAGLGIIGFGIWGFMEGHRRSFKAMMVGVFVALGAGGWAFGTDDDE